jgi:hypothetical protein
MFKNLLNNKNTVKKIWIYLMFICFAYIKYFFFIFFALLKNFDIFRPIFIQPNKFKKLVLTIVKNWDIMYKIIIQNLKVYNTILYLKNCLINLFLHNY